MARLTLSIENKLKDQVDKIALDNRRTVTAEINMMIEEAIAARKGKK